MNFIANNQKKIFVVCGSIATLIIVFFLASFSAVACRTSKTNQEFADSVEYAKETRLYDAPSALKVRAMNNTPGSYSSPKPTVNTVYVKSLSSYSIGDLIVNTYSYKLLFVRRITVNTNICIHFLDKDGFEVTKENIYEVTTDKDMSEITGTVTTYNGEVKRVSVEYLR